MNYSYNDINIMFFKTDYVYMNNQISLSSKLDILNNYLFKDIISNDMYEIIIDIYNKLKIDYDNSLDTIIEYELNRNTAIKGTLINNIKNTTSIYSKIYNKYSNFLPKIKEYIKYFICLDLLTTTSIDEYSNEELNILEYNLKRILNDKNIRKI